MKRLQVYSLPMSLPVVDRNALRSAVEPLCPDIPPDIVHDFISRMDPEYFRRFDQTALIRHLRLAARLTPERPCEVAITEQGINGMTSPSWPTTISPNSPRSAGCSRRPG